MPNGGYRMVENGLKAYGYEPDPRVGEIFTKYRKTHNQGVFDAYTPDIRAARNSHIITGFGSISMTGKRESSVLCWQIRRQGSTDADAGVARLLEFDIHYYSVKAGTVTPIPPAP